MAEAPKQIGELIAKFDQNLDAYHTQYGETEVRVEFINPFIEALGWDVTNKAAIAEAYKDVIHEDAVKVGGATKAPDYSFRIGGTRKFFLEAKRPSVSIKDDTGPAYQLRRYAWSAKLPLSILTNFAEFAVYDCHLKPKENDKASTGRILYFTYQDYASRWEEITAIFSKDAVLHGSFDKFAESGKGKRGTSQVDTEFLNEIESWRDALAKNLALRNPRLSVRDLNFAVQRTIDRVIFLRMCEDRGIEHYGQLLALLNGENIYKRLHYLYGLADDKYNSGLFHFKEEKGRAEPPDELTLKLKIDDKVLKDIIRRLYYPESPYEFSVLGADILGNVYEQFLGKVIRLTTGHQARVEEKPEVKKAGGVYYTPAYIVEYIVKNTVGKLCKSKTPKQIEKLKILDPACGSGSFLIGAYTYLLNHHRDWYVKDGLQKHTKEIYQGSGGQWLLTTQEKKRILLNNIYGVDIDSQAVEVTKLSLLLRVLEGESEETIGKNLKLFRERALPDLGNNIKCGNSLIGPDFYQNKQMFFLDDEERYRINVFDWNSEFPQVFPSPSGRGTKGEGNGGFDAVIGNPPYVRQEELGETKSYYQLQYKTFRSTGDLYVNFIEKGLSLLKKGGLFGMIVSNKWLRAAYGQPLREFLADGVSVLQIVDLAGLPVFPKATVRTLILICTPQPKQNGTIRYLAPVSMEDFQTINSGDRLQELVNLRGVDLPRSMFSSDSWSFSRPGSEQLIRRIKQDAVPLEDYVGGKMFRGVVTGMNSAFIIDRGTRNRLIAQDKKCAEIIRPVLAGKDIHRYSVTFRDNYLIFTRRGTNINHYPSVLKYLAQYRRDLTPKKTGKEEFGRKPGRYQWYEIQDTIDYYPEFEKPKIIYPDIATACRFALDREGYFGSNTTYFIPSNDLYLLGILNSNLGQFYFSEVCAGLEGRGTTYLRFFGQYLEGFPVRSINFDVPTEKARHGKMVTLVERMFTLHKELAAAKNPNDKTKLQREIEATDRQIDQLVYELYGLTEEEIKIVEQGIQG